MRKLDAYIIRKFLSTFFFALLMIIVIAVIFDVSEKLDDFLDKDVPFKAIVFDYYVNFIPYFINLFSPLFVFISVVFFTSRMAARTEIIAILASGVSFRRLLLPFVVSSLLIGLLTFYLGAYIIPGANAKRLAFEFGYLKNNKYARYNNVFKQIAPGVIISLESYDEEVKTAYQFSYEKMSDRQLLYKLNADYLRWNEAEQQWKLENFVERKFKNGKELIRLGAALDTTLGFDYQEFKGMKNEVEMMSLPELNAFIAAEKAKGSDQIEYYRLEKYKRFAFPMATLVLTLIAVPLAGRKVRGGIGLHMGLGLAIAFTYIFLMQVTSVFATEGGIDPAIAVWIPNIMYFLLALYFLKKAPK